VKHTLLRLCGTLPRYVYKQHQPFRPLFDRMA
jgi:hypothetical protein